MLTKRITSLGILCCVLLSSLQGQYLSYQTQADEPFAGSLVLHQAGELAHRPDIQVYLASLWEEQGQHAPMMLGQQYDTADLRVFRPLLPFRPGLRYWAQAQNAEPILFQVPFGKAEPPTRVLSVYPSLAEIPENQLKMYVVFDRPMRRGDVYQHLRLIHPDGRQEMPFLALQPELWDSTRQRLTLWFDPGRVKRELVLNQTHGSPLQAGQDYTLMIDSTWRDSRGKPLAQHYVYSFRASAPDRQSPDPGHWEIIPAQAGTRDTLRIQFGEALDYALLLSALRLMDENGQRIAGTVSVGKKQQSWCFVPDQAWQVGTYRIRVEARLEDLAGNNLNRLFDTDLAQQNTDRKQAYYWLLFEIIKP